MLSWIHRAPSWEEAITFDELQQRVQNIKHVWSMQLLLHAMEIASLSSTHGAIKGAIWCNFHCMRRKLHAVADVCGGLKFHLNKNLHICKITHFVIIMET